MKLKFETKILYIMSKLFPGTEDKKRRCQCPVCFKKGEAIAKEKATIQPTVM